MQTELDSKTKTRLRRKLLTWFDCNLRDLPWRKRKSPYKTWVSEIMLQQTQVATVIAYFNRFVKRFPDVAALASADESEVLKFWEGLGYYRRARQMHAAAKKIVSQHGGKFPTCIEEVLALPGIGRYTAGAILSISLDQQHPILEGNTIRLFARLMGMPDDPRTTANQKLLWSFSESLLPRNRVGDFNQALMELGALVCKARSPDCQQCPLASCCSAFADSTQNEIPVAGRKMNYESIREQIVIVERGSKILVRLCGPAERWAGLWDFPRFGATSKTSVKGQTEFQLARQIQESFGLSVSIRSFGKPIKHAVTRFRITLDCFRTEQVVGRLKTSKGQRAKWVSLDELERLPLSSTGRKIASRLIEIGKKGNAQS